MRNGDAYNPAARWASAAPRLGDLDVGGASLCLINTHLPAGQSHPEERNATFAEVLRARAPLHDRYMTVT